MKSAVVDELHSNRESGKQATQRSHAGIFASIGRALTALGSRVSEARRVQRTFEDLNAMSDRDLEDIGITRADIPAIVTGVYRDARPAASNVIPLDHSRKFQTPEAAAALPKKPSNG